MTILKLLQTKLPQFTWTQESKHSSIFGCITVPQIDKRIGGDLYKLNNVYVFISSKMGGTELSGAPFRYAMCYQKAEVRPYRCKNTFIAEFNKLFVSDKNALKVVNKLIKEIDMNKYYLTK